MDHEERLIEDVAILGLTILIGGGLVTIENDDFAVHFHSLPFSSRSGVSRTVSMRLFFKIHCRDDNYRSDIAACALLRANHPCQEAACERCLVHLLRESRFRLDRSGLDIGADVGDDRMDSTTARL